MSRRPQKLRMTRHNAGFPGSDDPSLPAPATGLRRNPTAPPILRLDATPTEARSRQPYLHTTTATTTITTANPREDHHALILAFEVLELDT